jgi:hypothetical protein
MNEEFFPPSLRFKTCYIGRVPVQAANSTIRPVLLKKGWQEVQKVQLQVNRGKVNYDSSSWDTFWPKADADCNDEDHESLLSFLETEWEVLWSGRPFNLTQWNSFESHQFVNHCLGLHVLWRKVSFIHI